MPRGFMDDDDDGNEPVDLGLVKFVRQGPNSIIVQPDAENDAFDGDLVVPDSQVHADSEIFKGCKENVGKLVVRHWWAEKEGLI